MRCSRTHHRVGNLVGVGNACQPQWPNLAFGLRALRHSVGICTANQRSRSNPLHHHLHVVGQRNRLNIKRVAINQQRVPVNTCCARQLIHNPARHTRCHMFRAPTQLRKFGYRNRASQRQRSCNFQRRTRRQPRTNRDRRCHRTLNANRTTQLVRYARHISPPRRHHVRRIGNWQVQHQRLLQLFAR